MSENKSYPIIACPFDHKAIFHILTEYTGYIRFNYILIIDQQIARYFVPFGECIYHLHPLPSPQLK